MTGAVRLLGELEKEKEKYLGAESVQDLFLI